MGSDELIPHVPSQRYQMGLLCQGWSQTHNPSKPVPSPAPAPPPGGQTPVPFAPLGARCGSTGSRSITTLLQPEPSSVRGSAGQRGTGAAAHVDISALNDSLVFCCVFLRDRMPEQTAFLGLHPIFIL